LYFPCDEWLLHLKKINKNGTKFLYLSIDLFLLAVLAICKSICMYQSAISYLFDETMEIIALNEAYFSKKIYIYKK